MKNIKKILCLFLTMLLLVSSITPVMANNDIKVKIDGQQIAFDVPPQLINDRTMVPLRAIFEALGATVDWNNDTRTVTSTKGNKTISLTINNTIMYVNGEAVTLDSPACLVSGRTLVPVRAISEAFGAIVNWDNTTSTVSIATNNANKPVVSNPKLARNDIEITLKPDASSAIFVNKSNASISFNVLSINGSLIMRPNNSSNGVVVNPGETKFVQWIYDGIYNKKGANNGVNSYGYVVIEWNGKQYYADFTVNGITTFYRGNARGPIAE